MMTDTETIAPVQHAGVWQDETKVETLKALWPMGVQAPEIAAAIGVTKSAVIAKAHQLGLGPHPNANNSTWTEERLDKLKEYAGQGLSAGSIAHLLGGISASGVKDALKKLRAGEAVKRKGDSPWTDEKVEELKRLWFTDMQTKDVARALGVSENAVSGMVFVLRGQGIAMPARMKPPPKPVPAAALNFKSAPDGVPAPKAPARLIESRSLIAINASLPPTDEPLSSAGCRWPVGDPRAITNPAAYGMFRFCCAPKAGSGPYCHAHEAHARNGGVRHDTAEEETACRSFE